MDGIWSVSKKDLIKNNLDSMHIAFGDFFELAVEGTLNELNNKIKNSQQKYQELHKKLSIDYLKKGEKPSPQDYEILNDLYELTNDDMWNSEHRHALSEMKIVYLFKSLEIGIKNIISTAYPDIKTKDLYKWENVITFFKTKNIDITKFPEYQDANDLRKVNNNIKHSSDIDEDVKKIKEFKDSDSLLHELCETFYNRVKPKLIDFIKSLSQIVISDLYDFPDERLNGIALGFTNRMDKATAEKFTKMIMINYKCELRVKNKNNKCGCDSAKDMHKQAICRTHL